MDNTKKNEILLDLLKFDKTVNPKHIFLNKYFLKFAGSK